jgi:hypothetical protein
MQAHLWLTLYFGCSVLCVKSFFSMNIARIIQIPAVCSVFLPVSALFMCFFYYSYEAACMLVCIISSDTILSVHCCVLLVNQQLSFSHLKY